MFGLCAQQGLGKRVCDHVLGRTIFEGNLVGLDDIVYEVESDIDMFCAGVVLLIASEDNCRLGIRVKCHWSVGLKDFGDKFVKLNCFLCSVGSGHILGFSSGECDNGLAF